MSPDIHPGRSVIAPLTLIERNAIRLAEFLATKNGFQQEKN